MNNLSSEIVGALSPNCTLPPYTVVFHTESNNYITCYVHGLDAEGAIETAQLEYHYSSDPDPDESLEELYVCAVFQGHPFCEYGLVWQEGH